MKGERLIEIGGALLFAAFIVYMFGGLTFGIDHEVMVMIQGVAFFGLAILGFILVGVGWWVKKEETERD